MRRLLLGLLIFGILPLAIFGIIQQVRAARERQPLIDSMLIQPYAEALKEGRYAEAYRDLTSQGYRSAYSLEDFEKAQQAARAARGALTAIRVRSAFQGAGNLFSGRSFLRGELTYRYEKGEVLVVWEISEVDKTFRIDAQFEELTETLRAGIY